MKLVQKLVWLPAVAVVLGSAAFNSVAQEREGREERPAAERERGDQPRDTRGREAGDRGREEAGAARRREATEPRHKPGE